MVEDSPRPLEDRFLFVAELKGSVAQHWENPMASSGMHQAL